MSSPKHTLLLGLVLALALPAPVQDSAYARRIVRDLTSPAMYGRGMQHRGDSIAAAYLVREMQRIGVQPLGDSYYQYFHFPRTTTRPPLVTAGYRSQNVCGVVRGEVDTMLVFTAHYEHLGMHGDTVFYGAHDNASGTAAVMDLARMAALRPGRYTCVFLLFGGEEAGLVGSHHFAEHPLIDLAKVKLLVNIDLFCGGDEGLMVVNANAPGTAPYVDRLQQLNEQHRYAAQVKRRDNAANSDHYWFTSRCPAIFIYTLGGPYGGYHSPDDTCDGCGLGRYDSHMALLRALVGQF